MILACYAGTGKTTAAKLFPEEVLDMEIVPYKYVFPGDYDLRSYDEAAKAQTDFPLRRNYPSAYTDDVQKNALSYRFVLIPTDARVLRELERRGEEFTVIIPDRRDERMREIYEERYRARGNSENFLDVFIGGWDFMLKMVERHPGTGIRYLAENEYVSDVIRECFLKTEEGCQK